MSKKNIGKNREKQLDQKHMGEGVLRGNKSHVIAFGVLIIGVMFFLSYTGGYNSSGNGETKISGQLIAQPKPSNNPSPVGDTKESAEDVVKIPLSTISDTKESAEDVVKIPLSEISTSVKKYTYDVGDRIIKYMVVLGSDGNVRTAFDACEVCGGRKGYRQTGSDVTCIKCGRYFKIDDLGSKNKGGGCWPSHLLHTIDNGYVVIQKSDLDSGRKYF